MKPDADKGIAALPALARDHYGRVQSVHVLGHHKAHPFACGSIHDFKNPVRERAPDLNGSGA